MSHGVVVGVEGNVCKSLGGHQAGSRVLADVATVVSPIITVTPICGQWLHFQGIFIVYPQIRWVLCTVWSKMLSAELGVLARTCLGPAPCQAGPSSLLVSALAL